MRSTLVLAEAGDEVGERGQLGGDGGPALGQPVQLGPAGADLALQLGVAGGSQGLGLDPRRGDDLLGLAAGAGQDALSANVELVERWRNGLIPGFVPATDGDAS